MELKEALIFLDLTESATEADVKERIKERLALYERLSQAKGSAFLSRLNGQHLQKILLVKNTRFRFVEKRVRVPEPLQSESEKFILKDQLTPKVHAIKPVLPPEQSAIDLKELRPVAFLVRHTEQLEAKTFPLFPGENYIGRKAHPKFKPFITLEDDEFISRVHSLITLESGGDFWLNDSDHSNGGRASTNGTFLNGNKNKVFKRTSIRDMDTIQIGMTKLIFRIFDKNLTDLIREVEHAGYAQTVVIKI